MKLNRRRAAALLALLLPALLAGCGKEKAKDLTLTNGLERTIHNAYLSLNEYEEWGEPVTAEALPAGESAGVNFADFGVAELPEEEPVLCDLGAIDEDALNYDVYKIPLLPGDVIRLTAEGEKAVVFVTHPDETEDVYEGFTYPEPEE